MFMAKSLGQIHTVNMQHAISDEDPGQLWPVDLSRGLSDQLQRNIRQGQNYKLVGIDANLHGFEVGVDVPEGGSVTGKILFWSPTRGRCMAYRNAFKATMSAMKDQGINHKANKAYDFRVAFRDSARYAPPYIFPDHATLDGTDGLAMIDGSAQNANILQVHNSNVLPFDTTATLNVIPFGTYGNTTDFVLNESSAYLGNPDLASTIPEEIPFAISWDNDAEEFALTFQWRPDPALYISVMLGLIDIRYDNVEMLSSTDRLNIGWSFHIAGWKSIMGSPDKKKRSKRSTRGRRKSKK